MDLPEQPIPTCATSLHRPIPPKVQRPNHDCTQLHAYTDSDWATCTKTRQSFSGIIVQLAGGTIAYKTKMQPTVALSSTEAEFMVACDTGKMILFIRVFCGIWESHSKLPPSFMRTMMHVRLWQTPRNQPRGRATWT